MWPGDIQGQPINIPLDPSTHLTDPFDSAHETITVEDDFCVYPKSSLSNGNWRVSRLIDRENEESWNCDKAISSYNQMYADALLSGQLQDKESNSFEQIVDALIRK